MRKMTLVSLIASLFLAVLLIGGCVSSTVTSQQISTPAPTPALTTTQSPTGTPLTSPGSSPTASTSPPTSDWPTYHRDLSRSGFEPGVSMGSSLHRLWASTRLDGDVYAEPLVVGQMVLAATEQDTVYSLDTQTGQVIWHVSLGTPVPLSELGCGDINPSGITSTPVADPAAGRLYVVGRIQPNHHELFAIDITNGAILWHRTVDPPGTNPKYQQQRAALTLVNDRVYISYGGLAGDCGTYYGCIVGAPTDGTGQLLSYQVSSKVGAALWAPSGPAADSAGNVYMTSGNGDSGSTFDYDNAVLCLSPDLALKDWFAPTNWQTLSNGDVDLGSMGPLLLQDSLVFQAGKEGKGYLLNMNNLGHIGGELFSAAIGGGAYGGAAYAPPYVFVPCSNGLVALQIQSEPAFKTVWSGPGFSAGPPVVSGSTVLTLDTGSGTLYALSADKGEVLLKMQLGTMMHFTTPSLSGGNVFVAAGRQIIRLGP